MLRMPLLAIVLICQCAMGPRPYAAADDPVVRSEGKRFVISGNQTFSDEQILDALVDNVEFLMATHPQADVAAMPKIVQQVLIAGYRRTGFPDVTVDVVPGPVPREATITVREGKRFRCGRVRVEGAAQVDAGQLVQRLTLPFPDKDARLSYEIVDGVRKPRWINASGDTADLKDPIWTQGEPTPFGKQDTLGKQLRTALQDLGFSQAQVEVKLVNDQRKATTTMLVRLVEGGEPDIVDEVLVEGLERNSVERLLSHGGATRGMRLNRQQIARVTERLWSCGRFSELEVRREKSIDGRLNLKITVKEVPNVPLLGEAVSREATAYLKARRWIAEAIERGDDLVIHSDEDPWQVMFVQSKQGQILHFTQTSERTPDGNPKFGAFLLDRGQWLVCYTPTGTKYHGRLLMKDLGFKINTEIGASDDSAHVWAFGLGVGIATGREKNDPIVRLALILHPSGFLPFAYKSQLAHTWEGNTLVSTRRLKDGSDEMIRVDLETGAITVRTGTTHLTFERGRFDRERRRIEERTKTFRNTYDERRPVSTLIAYACQPKIVEAITNELSADTAHQRHLASAMHKLAVGNVFQPIDQMASTTNDPAEGPISLQDKFSIPMDAPSNVKDRSPFAYLAGYSIVRTVNKVFPEGSWPLRITRQAGFVVMGRSEHSSAVLREIYTDARCGPLCHATVAVLMSRVNAKVAALFARRAMEQLNAESFDRDYRALITGEFGQWMSHTIAALRSLTPGEVDAIVVMLSKDDRVAGVLRCIRSTTNQGAGSDDGVLRFEDVKEDLERWLRAMTK